MTGTGWIEDAASALAPIFINSFWQGFVLAVVAGLVLRSLGTRRGLSAATRYAAWSTVLLAVVALPIASGGSRLAPSPGAGPGAVPAPVLSTVPATGGSFVEPSAGVVYAKAPPDASSSGPSAREEVTAQPVLEVPAGGWVFGVAVAWWLGVVWLSARVVRGFVVLQRLKRRSRPLPPAVRERLDGWLAVAGRQGVRVATTDALTTPVAAGVLRPTVLVPADLLEALTPDELDQVVLHELAHLARWDDWTHLFQKAMQAVFFFHPVVHWIGCRMDEERERACDDWVVSRTRRPRSYASCLTRLVELNVQARAVRMAPGMAVRKSRIVERVRRVLAPMDPAAAGVSRYGVVTAAGAVAMTVLVFLTAAPVVVLTGPARADAPAPEPVTIRRADRDVPSEAAPRPVRDAPGAGGQTSAGPSDEGASGGDVSRRAGLTPLPPREATPDPLPTPSLQEDAPRSAPEGPDLSVASWIKVLRAATGIASAGERTTFLLAALDRMPSHPDVIAAYLGTAKTISSSGDRARAIDGLLSDRRLEPASWPGVLDAVKGIRSSSEKARLLVQSAGLLPDDEAARTAFLDAAESVSSSADRRRVLSALVQAEQE